MLNRRDGSIVRTRQDGTVVGVRHVVVPGAAELGTNRLNGIAVASDAQHIYLTERGGSGQDWSASGAIIEVPALGGATVGAAPSLIARGAAAFRRSFSGSLSAAWAPVQRALLRSVPSVTISRRHGT